MLSVPVPALAHLGWPCGCQSLCLNKESLLIAEKEGTVAYPQPPAAMSVVLNEGRFSAFLFPELTVPRELLLEGFVTATPRCVGDVTQSWHDKDMNEDNWPRALWDEVRNGHREPWGMSLSQQVNNGSMSAGSGLGHWPWFFPPGSGWLS